MNDEKKGRIQRMAGYALGSVALCAAACKVLPKIFPKATSMAYKLMYGPSDFNVYDDNDDWGPEIIRKHKPAEEVSIDKKDIENGSEE